MFSLTEDDDGNIVLDSTHEDPEKYALYLVLYLLKKQQEEKCVESPTKQDLNIAFKVASLLEFIQKEIDNEIKKPELKLL